MTELPPLAQFLRSSRERITPEQAGLTPNDRRRTPGLRREEVATLAGVSIDYLVRLEQGRDTNPSHEVLLSLADALQLGDYETQHLMALALVGNSPRMERFCPALPALDAAVPPSVQAMLDQLDPTPAYVVGPIGDVVGSNSAWRTLVAPLGLTDGANLADHVFAHPDVYLDQAEVADGEVARLRAAQVHLRDDERFANLLDGLLQDPGFAQRWNTRTDAAPGRGRLRLRHPAGTLDLDYESLALSGDHQRLVCWLPADLATESALEALVTESPVSPARLRVVGEG